MKFNLSNKVYFRWLALFVAILGISQMGWLVYLLTPATPSRAIARKRLSFPILNSPIFKYSYKTEVAPASGSPWQEIVIPEETGRKLLTLLRGSTNLTLMTPAIVRKTPGGLAPPLTAPASVGRLVIYEAGAEDPSLTIDFLGYYDVMVEYRNSSSDRFVIPPEQGREIEEIIREIQGEPLLKNEP